MFCITAFAAAAANLFYSGFRGLITQIEQINYPKRKEKCELSPLFASLLQKFFPLDLYACLEFGR